MRSQAVEHCDIEKSIELGTIDCCILRFVCSSDKKHTQSIEMKDWINAFQKRFAEKKW